MFHKISELAHQHVRLQWKLKFQNRWYPLQQKTKATKRLKLRCKLLHLSAQCLGIWQRLQSQRKVARIILLLQQFCAHILGLLDWCQRDLFLSTLSLFFRFLGFRHFGFLCGRGRH